MQRLQESDKQEIEEDTCYFNSIKMFNCQLIFKDLLTPLIRRSLFSAIVQ